MISGSLLRGGLWSGSFASIGIKRPSAAEAVEPEEPDALLSPVPEQADVGPEFPETGEQQHAPEEESAADTKSKKPASKKKATPKTRRPIPRKPSKNQSPKVKGSRRKKEEVLRKPASKLPFRYFRNHASWHSGVAEPAEGEEEATVNDPVVASADADKTREPSRSRTVARVLQGRF